MLPMVGSSLSVAGADGLGRTARGGWTLAWSRNGLLISGLAVLIVLVTMALLARVIAPAPPLKMNVLDALRPPSGQHWFGTDRFGRDIFSRVVYGTRISLWIAFASLAIAVTLGTALGLLAAFYGRAIDAIASRLMDIFFSFPALLLAIAIAAMLGPSMNNAVIAIAVIYTPRFYRVARASTLLEKGLDYIEGARAVGARDASLIFRHLLPNIISPIVVQASIGLSQAILVEAALGYLGLGVQPPAPSWGTMLNEGRTFLQNAPWLSIFPGLAILLAVLAFNLVGDGLRDVLDPRAQGKA